MAEAETHIQFETIAMPGGKSRQALLEEAADSLDSLANVQGSEAARTRSEAANIFAR